MALVWGVGALPIMVSAFLMDQNDGKGNSSAPAEKGTVTEEVVHATLANSDWGYKFDGLKYWLLNGDLDWLFFLSHFMGSIYSIS
jgi:hypothetical protein